MNALHSEAWEEPSLQLPQLGEEKKSGATGRSNKYSSNLVGPSSLLAMVAGVSATVLAKMLAGALRGGTSSGEEDHDDDEAPTAGNAVADDADGEGGGVARGRGVWLWRTPWLWRWEKVSSCE
tara:strand:+ start:219 stop:587 length:369 start_codon:yes stop_codon:yes gene_type:complete